MGVRAGYKKTEVGIIPEDWKVISLGELANIQRGASPRPIDSPIWFDEKSCTGWLRISDVSKAKKYLTETTQNLSPLGIASSRFVATNNLVMSICATVGRPILTKKDVCIHDGFVVFKNLNADQEYIYYILSDRESNWSNQGQIGSQMNLNTTLINSTKIPLPQNLDEQIAIAKALSDIDDLIIKLEKLIDKKQLIKQGAMQKLLNPFDKNGRIKEGWEEKRLGDIATFLKGKGLSKDKLTTDSKYFCIHYGELFTKYKEKISRIFSSTEYCENAFYSAENDILMPTSDVTPDGLATASCILEDNIILGSDILVIRPKKNLLDGIFFSYLVNIERNQIMQLVSGSTVYHLYGLNMANFKFVAPIISEQKAISEHLVEMDIEISVLESKLEKTIELKQGMMQQLLTGQIRLVNPQGAVNE